MGERITETFLLLFCEKNSDGTKNLVLKGKDLWQRIEKRIKNDDMHKIASFLKNHPEVISLDLCYNNVSDRGLGILIDEYLNFDNPLLHLNLMYNNITDKGIANLVSMKYITLRSLRLNGNKFGPEGGKSLALLLTYTDTILHLDIGETDQTLVSVAYFVKLLNENYHPKITLRVLDLSRIIPYFNRHPYDSAHFAETIGQMIRFNHSLIEIHLQKNQIDCHDLELMLIGLRENNTLLFLDIGYNRIADYGIELLGNFIKTRPSLLGVNVAGNGITNTGARALSFAMPFSRIRLLDIGHNKITDKGMLDLLNSIKKPTQMRMLFIWGNVFTHKTNKVIKRMIMSKVLDQNYLDVKIYEVDEVLYTAYYPADRYKHKYYCVMDYACPVELKIKQNYIPTEPITPRAKTDFKFYPRFPPIDKPKPKKRSPVPKRIDPDQHLPSHFIEDFQV